MILSQNDFVNKIKRMGQVKAVNTSNPGKAAEYRRFLGKELKMTDIDLEEPDSDEITVIRYKASQVPEGTLVEDTSLHVESVDVGVNVKWLLSTLPDHVGKKASFVVYMAYRHDERIHVYKGQVDGVITESSGSGGFGFDNVFLPNGTDKTLAEEKPVHYNPRYIVVQKFITGDQYGQFEPLYQWDGPWQD